MIWKDYSALNGTHAFLSPSKHHWINYPPEKLEQSYQNHRKIALGIQYHKLASDLINLAVRQANNTSSFNCFVNDAIGWKMTPEVLLFYSKNCYGTADAISFKEGVLRIHDLKTGSSPASINQLLIYAGLFCLDYEVEPKEIKETNLKIYQNDSIIEFTPGTEDIFRIVSRIVEADKIVERMNLIY